MTQFGEEGTVRGRATVTVVEGESYETLWEARSDYELFGGTSSWRAGASPPARSLPAVVPLVSP